MPRDTQRERARERGGEREGENVVQKPEDRHPERERERENESERGLGLKRYEPPHTRTYTCTYAHTLQRRIGIRYK